MAGLMLGGPGLGGSPGRDSSQFYFACLQPEPQTQNSCSDMSLPTPCTLHSGNPLEGSAHLACPLSFC